MTPATVQEALQPIVADALGPECRIDQCRRLTAGASAATWWVGTTQQPLILRLEAGGEQFGTGVGKTVEAKTQQAAGDAGAPVAKVFCILEDHPQLGNGYLMQALEGESLAPKILKAPELEAVRAGLTRQCAEALAKIHSISSAELPFLPLQDAAEQLDSLQRIHHSFGETLPVFTLAFRWLSDNIPPCPQPALVHGDFRLGNFLITEQGLNGILDWELTHLGDPMEDLGWLCVRAWRFNRPDKTVGGFGDRHQLIEAYEQARGVQVNPEHLRYWELFGTLKWGVICQYQAYSHLNNQVRSVERAAIGRRVAETEYDMLQLLNAIAHNINAEGK
ncbi:phosphotransferase family protein [Ketobacter sp.]|uniref:phosphotransferase family protein n=1 Tax=Ketobacter sp. TaxID=2083498 RepID=UPI000F193A24|nr:phosphotransferase family protein [Ketobacter sp.]RLU00766.1 MAG: phosphotransferase family protein [Ketobacter sp.]